MHNRFVRSGTVTAKDKCPLGCRRLVGRAQSSRQKGQQCNAMQYTSVYVHVCVCVSIERGGGVRVVLPGLPCGCWCRRVFRKLKQLNFDEKPSDATLNCNLLALPSIFKMGRKCEEEERACQAGVLVCGTWQRGKFIMSQLKLTKLSSSSSSNLHLSVVFYGRSSGEFSSAAAACGTTGWGRWQMGL